MIFTRYIVFNRGVVPVFMLRWPNFYIFTTLFHLIVHLIEWQKVREKTCILKWYKGPKGRCVGPSETHILPALMIKVFSFLLFQT